MTPEQIALVEQTSSPLLLAPATTAFYARLFEAEPALRPLFPAALPAQEAKFVAGLRLVVASLHDHPELLARCRQQGALHRAHGAEPLHYALVGGALLGALGDVLGTAWTPELEQAWAAAYSVTAELMMSGAREAAVQVLSLPGQGRLGRI